jgi:hypothetical protein
MNHRGIQISGQRLASERKRKLWTLEDLSRESGIPVRTLTRYENSDPCHMQFSKYRSLTTALGITDTRLQINPPRPAARIEQEAVVMIETSVLLMAEAHTRLTEMATHAGEPTPRYLGKCLEAWLANNPPRMSYLPSVEIRRKSPAPKVKR